jgi:hypothetical protein
MTLWKEIAALRDFDPVFVGSGSKPEFTALQHSRPVPPQLADIP